jgi:cobalt-zinc-cadmium efflux system outer membrane protein
MNLFVRPLIFSFLIGALAAPASLPAQATLPDSSPTQISALVAEITHSNPELKFYEAEIAAAKAGTRSAGSLSDPEVALDLGRKRVTDPTGALAGSGIAWSISVTQTFEWPGRLGLRKAIANRNVELAELGLARFQNALTTRARTLAYGLYVASQEAAALREVADRFAALKATFLARDPAGVTPLLETRVIEASELSLQRRASEAELALQAALIELNQLRGAAPDALLRVAAPTLKFNAPPATSVLLAAARENNFEFKIRQLELEQQGFQMQLARNERYPAVSVSPYYSQEKAGDRESIVGVGLSLPLPLTSRTRSAVDLAASRQRQAEAAALMAQRDLERDVVTAAYTFATKLGESGRWAPDSVTRFREAAELADRHYRLGAVPIGTYVELQNSYLDAVAALLSTQREALEAGLRLQELTGLNLSPEEVGP